VDGEAFGGVLMKARSYLGPIRRCRTTSRPADRRAVGVSDLASRGLSDIFVACIDGLAGFAEAIHTAYPRTSVQLCLVHLVRAALRYVSTQDSQAVARDLKKIYQAATVIEAEQALAAFVQAWDAKYPTIAKMWRAMWTDIITLFDYPPAIRKAIYTTNAIESVNSVIRKFTRNRKIPQRGVGSQERVHGHSGGVRQVDDADPSLETGPQMRQR
jgi:putative transposase